MHSNAKWAVGGVLAVAAFAVALPSVIGAQGDDYKATAPPGLDRNVAPMIPGGQQYSQTATFSTSSTSFVGLNGFVTVKNTDVVPKNAVLRWTGTAAHRTQFGWINIAPMIDGTVLPDQGTTFLAYDIDGVTDVSDNFGVQWTISVPPGTHTLRPAMSSSNGSFRNIDGYHLSVEMKTK